MPQKVIALEDETSMSIAGDDWEDVDFADLDEDDVRHEHKASYAATLSHSPG